MQRKIVSLVTFFSFLVLIISSVVMYCTPEGRVAYWANWTILGLSKPQWTHLHITGGLLFMVGGIWHTLLNWKPIIHYMGNTMHGQARNPIPLLAAVSITVFVYAGTFLPVPPMQQALNWNSDIKKYHATTYGNPPYAHAELSTLGRFCEFLQLDADTVVAYLKKQNLKGEIAKQSTLLALAKANGISPQTIYTMIRKSVATDNPFGTLPASPPEGTGKLSLQVFCTQFAIPFEAVNSKLTGKGMPVTPEDTLSAIAKRHNLASAREVYAILRDQ